MPKTFEQGFEEVREDLTRQLHRQEHPVTPKDQHQKGRELALKAAVQALSEWKPRQIDQLESYLGGRSG